MWINLNFNLKSRVPTAKFFASCARDGQSKDLIVDTQSLKFET